MESCAGEMMTAGHAGDASAQHGPSMNKKFSSYALICLIVLFATAVFLLSNLLIDLSYLFPFLHSFLPLSTFEGKGLWGWCLASLVMSIVFSSFLFWLFGFIFKPRFWEYSVRCVSYQTAVVFHISWWRESSCHITWYQGFGVRLCSGSGWHFHSLSCDLFLPV